MLHADILTNMQNELDALQGQLLHRDCSAFLPELILCGSIVLLLIVRLFGAFNRLHLGWLSLLLAGAALAVSIGQWQGFSAAIDPRYGTGHNSLELFSGLLAYDNFTIFLRVFLIGFMVLVIWLSMLTGIPDREDSSDFYVLLFGAVLGMCIMASANHLLMIFLGVEMASLPSYALAGFLKGRRQSSEASLKYVVYGGGASGVMLYGISLLAGKFGTAYLPGVAMGYTKALAAMTGGASFDVVLMLATVFFLIGVAFKVSAVPFHFWCPDVFEGASAEVAGFLSVASKGAALALLGRFVLVLAGLGGTHEPNYEAWSRAVNYLAPTLGFFAALTATFGNLAAYAQTNLKRLLAYSTIAQAGYMMMGLVTMTREGASAVLFYLAAYLFMNLGAFAIVAFLRNLTGSEDLGSFRGLIRRSPVAVITLGVFLLSLLGLPPLVGFAAKLQIFSVLFEASNYYNAQGLHFLGTTMIVLLVIAGINTAISAVYYLKVLKVMVLQAPLEEVEDRESPAMPLPEGAELFAVLLALVVLILGILWDPLLGASRKGVDHFLDKPASQVAQGEKGGS
jgi:NADH-quinone oxidoreductase subunit N